MMTGFARFGRLGAKRAPTIITSSVSPLTIFGGQLYDWLNADRADLLTLVGAQVAGWKGIITGNDYVQALAGARPIYGDTSWNGTPGIYFDGVDDELTYTGMPFPTGSTACSIFALVDQQALPADTSARYAFGYGGDTNLVQRRIGRNVVSAENRLLGVSGNGTNGINSNTIGDLSGRHAIRSVHGSATIIVQLDGIGVASVNVVPATGASRARIGAVPNATAAAFWQGGIKEIFIVAGGITAGQVSEANLYMQGRR
jgi:hypothetical protein